MEVVFGKGGGRLWRPTIACVCLDNIARACAFRNPHLPDVGLDQPPRFLPHPHSDDASPRSHPLPRTATDSPLAWNRVLFATNRQTCCRRRGTISACFHTGPVSINMPRNLWQTVSDCLDVCMGGSNRISQHTFTTVLFFSPGTSTSTFCPPDTPSGSWKANSVPFRSSVRNQSPGLTPSVAARVSSALSIL